MGWSWSGIPDKDVADVVSVIVEVPDGVTMDAGGEGDGVTVGLALPQPAAQNTAHRRIPAKAPQCAQRLARGALSDIQQFLAAFIKTRATASRSSTRIPTGRTKRLGIEGGSMAPPLVDTVTVNGVGTPLAIETVAGTWHAAPSGAPLQESDTVPL